jgi:hypothetical protein
MAEQGVGSVYVLLKALTARQSDEINAYSGILRCPEILQDRGRFIWGIPVFNDEAPLTSLGSCVYADHEGPYPTLLALPNGFSQNAERRTQKPGRPRAVAALLHQGVCYRRGIPGIPGRDAASTQVN